MSKSGKVFIHQLSRLCNILAISLLQSKKNRVKILVKFLYLIGTRKLEVIKPITSSAPETKSTIKHEF